MATFLMRTFFSGAGVGFTSSFAAVILRGRPLGFFSGAGLVVIAALRSLGFFTGGAASGIGSDLLPGCAMGIDAALAFAEGREYFAAFATNRALIVFSRARRLASAICSCSC